MAELLGLGASVLAFVGLAGQMVQGASFLATFFGDMKDAPEDVQMLAVQLKTLGTILQSLDVESVDDGEDEALERIAEALACCKPWIDKLNTLIRRHNTPDMFVAGRVKLWSRMSTAFKKQKFSKYVRGLHDGLALLLHARMLYVESVLSDHP